MGPIINFWQNHKKKTIGILVLAVAVLGSLKLFATEQPQEITVFTGKITEDKFEQSVFATGTLQVKDKKDIFTKIGGTVKEIFVEPGEKVKAGQVILKLETDDLALKAVEARAVYNARKTDLIRLKANLRTAQKEYELAQEELGRTKSLYNLGAVSKVELDKAQLNFTDLKEKLQIIEEVSIPLASAELQEAEVALELAQKRLEEGTIISPGAGTLLSLNAEEGHPIQTGTLVASVGDLSKLEIETGINEVDAADLKIGNLVEISSDGLLDTTFKGHIEYIAPIAELERTSQGEQTQVKIRVALDEVDNSQLKPGYNVNLKVILAQRDKATLVPYEAVTQRNEQNVVFVVDQEGNVTKRPIEIGLSNALYFEVLSGLKAEEKVILSPNERIKEGIKVKVNDRNK